jgi:hypothetical protein
MRKSKKGILFFILAFAVIYMGKSSWFNLSASRYKSSKKRSVSKIRSFRLVVQFADGYRSRTTINGGDDVVYAKVKGDLQITESGGLYFTEGNSIAKIFLNGRKAGSVNLKYRSGGVKSVEPVELQKEYRKRVILEIKENMMK